MASNDVLCLAVPPVQLYLFGILIGLEMAWDLPYRNKSHMLRLSPAAAADVMADWAAVCGMWSKAGCRRCAWGGWTHLSPPVRGWVHLPAAMRCRGHYTSVPSLLCCFLQLSTQDSFSAPASLQGRQDESFWQEAEAAESMARLYLKLMHHGSLPPLGTPRIAGLHRQMVGGLWGWCGAGERTRVGGCICAHGMPVQLAPPGVAGR